MWNLSYTIPTFCILMIFLVFYFARPRIDVRINHTFVVLLVVDAATTIADYLSATMDMNYREHSMAALYAANTLFFVLFMLRSYLFYLFVVDLLHIRNKPEMGHALLGFGVLAIAELAAILSPWLHIMFYMDAQGYHRGWGYNILYVEFVFFVLNSLAVLWGRGRRLPRFEFMTVVVVNVMLLVGVAVRFLFPQLVLMNLFSLLGIVMLMLTFQNPGNNIEKRTGLFTRDAFELVVAEQIAYENRRQILGITVKNYLENRELYGGAQIDEGLTMIADYLKSEFRKYNLFYIRNGQFIIETRDGVDLDEIREKIRQRFQKPWKRRNANLYLQAGFVLRNAGKTFEAVEQFMEYLQSTFNEVNKVGTQNLLIIDDERRREWERAIKIRRAVENAIADDRVDVYLQPIVDAESFRVTGAEALARIEDPELGMIMPGEFIALAERYGSIIQLGEQVLRKVCEFMATYGEKTCFQWINVNLSPIQCVDNELPQSFWQILKEYHLSPAQIHLEITEQENVDQLLMNRQISKLTDLGFGFVLDDYGTGYSNIERVRKLPLINVKLDMSMVWEYFREPGSLLPFSIRILKDMGFAVTAEGVESEEMARKLKELGCTYLQGYYFSRPKPMESCIDQWKRPWQEWKQKQSG